MDIEKFKEMFLAEAVEHLEQMVETLVQLDSDPEDRDAIDLLFRSAHSIKGMAATMEHEETAKLAHHLEDRLDRCRTHKHISGAEIDWLLEATDLLELLLNDIRLDHSERDISSFIATTPAQVIPPPSAPKIPATTADNLIVIQLELTNDVVAPGARLLVVLKKLAEFGNVVDSIPTASDLLTEDSPRQLKIYLASNVATEELRVALQKFKELEKISFPEQTENKKKSPAKVTEKTVRVSTELLDHLISLTGELITNRYKLEGGIEANDWCEIETGVGQLSRLVKNLHHQVLQVRMVSLEGLIGRLTRTIHDLSRSSGKTVQLKVEGAQIKLDRAIVEAISDPLMHMVRNAIDHGIVNVGTIFIKAWREKDQIHIQVADDGNGIDTSKVRMQALQQGLIGEAQAKTIRPYDLLQLICQPGFSTASTVSETSGRGVGMDVVKTAVEQIGGIVLIESAPNEGARITLKLPLSLAIIRVLMVTCADSKLALPITRVIQTLELTPTDIQSSGKQLMIQYQQELLPMVSLRKAIKAPKGSQLEQIPVIITEVLGRKIALVVDQLIGQQEIFVQRLPEPFDQIRGFSGATILGDGEIVFLLDLQSLFERQKKIKIQSN